MKITEIRAKSQDQLNQLINDSKKELFNYRVQKKIGENIKTHQIKKARKNIAKALTVINETKSRKQDA